MVGLSPAASPEGQQSLRLQMRAISKSFGANRALSDVSIDLDAGEVHALIGENGAGKSTLMKVLSGAERPDAGSMTLEGEPYRPRGPRDALSQGVAMIYQELAIAPHLSVEANVMLGQEQTNLGIIKGRIHREKVVALLRQLGHEEIRPEAIAGSLSIGAQQLIEVARALNSNAKVIVFDEPTSSLTEQDAETLFEVIGRLRDQGLAIVYISHFLEEVERVADSYTVLRDGESVAHGKMSETTMGAIIHQMVGRPLTELFPKSDRSPGKPVLKLEHLAGRKLPTNADLELREGEILGIAGLVGAGRTELLRAIFGLDQVRSGTVMVKGVSGRSNPHRRIKQGVGFLSEDRKVEGLALNQSIEENITGSASERYAKAGWLDLGRRRRAAAHWIKEIRIRAGGPGDPVRSLSGGNQQKVAIARLLHQEAEILLLDEPTRGIDIGSKAEIYQMIADLAAQGRAILLVSSYLPELMGLCDRIAVMSRGRLGPAKPVSDWTQHAMMEAATGRMTNGN